MGRWRKRFGIAGAVIITLCGAYAAGWTWLHHWRPSDKYVFQGVDVAESNGAVDWWALKRAGADFGYIRVASATRRDARFEENWAAIAATGMRRGASHLYSLCRLASDQANAFNTTVPRDPNDLPAALELDFSPDCQARPTATIVQDEVRRYLSMVEAHTGKPVLLKVSKAFDAAYGVTLAIPRPVWAVQDFFPPDYPARSWRMWQANGARHVSGIDAPIHWDVVAP